MNLPSSNRDCGIVATIAGRALLSLCFRSWITSSVFSLLVIGSSLLLMTPDIASAESGKKSSGHSASKPAKSSSKSGHSSSKSHGKTKSKKSKDVEDVHGEHVLGADSHQIEKDLAQEAADAAYVDAVIVLDASRSMQRTDPNRLRDQGAKLFLRFLSQGDQVAVVQFSKEAKAVLPMTKLTPTNLATIDHAIESVATEGGFTDIEAGLEEAFTILSREGRHEATKAIILLSDGKMDPHPERGTPEALSSRVKDVVLSQFPEKHFKLYTLAFSEESDKALLADFAKAGGGLTWYAPDASTIHKKFSELFLTLKRPQVTPLEGEGFEVDSTVQEATFYINRKDVEGEITLSDPKGTTINSQTIPAGVKWFKGENFDVITISKPMAGHWGISGIKEVEGFATLLTDIKLQVRQLESSYKLGDTVGLYARLTNDGQEVSQPGLEDITFFRYKIVNTVTGETWLSGALDDKGEKGDDKAGDRIYSATVKLDQAGDYQALVAVTSQTFTRQQRLLFSVNAGLINLKLAPADDFAGTKEHLEVSLSRPATEYKSVKVQLVMKLVGGEKAVGLTLKPNKSNPQLFDVPMERLAPGKYELTARLTAIDSKKKEVQGSSETLHYTVAGEHVDGAETEVEQIDLTEESEPTDEPEAESESSSGDIILGIVGIFVALGWLAGLGFVGKKKVGSNKSQVKAKKAYTMSDDLAQRIQVIKDKASEARRHASADDREIFRSVAEIFGEAGVLEDIATPELEDGPDIGEASEEASAEAEPATEGE